MILSILATLPYGDNWRISFNTETHLTEFRPVGDDRDGEAFNLTMPDDMLEKAIRSADSNNWADSLWTPLTVAIFHHYQAQEG